MSIGGRWIERRTRADREYRHIRDADCHLVRLFELLRRGWELDKVACVEFDAANAGEYFLRVFPLGSNNLFAAVELDGQAKESAIRLLGVLLQFGHGGSARLGQQRTQFRIGWPPKAAQWAAVLRHPNYSSVFEAVPTLHHRNDVASLGDDHGSGQISFRSRQQVEAHLGHDAEVALTEQSIHIGASAVVVFRPGLGAWQRTHSRSNNLAIREDHFHAAMRVEVIAEAAEAIAHAMVQRIPNQAAPTGIGYVSPNFQAFLLHVPIQVEVGDARLHDREMPLVIHLNDPVHALQVEDYASRKVWSGAAIAQILAGRDRINRNPERVRNPDYLRDLFRRIGRYGRRHEDFFLFAPKWRVCVFVECYVIVTGKNPVLTDGTLKLLDCVSECLGVDVGRKCHTLLL